MAPIYKGKPNNPGNLVFNAVEFNVTDGMNNPLDSIAPNTPFNIVVKVAGSGNTWTFNQYWNKSWTTNFYANAIGIDVGGEVHWPPVTGALIADPFNPGQYIVQLNVPGGLAIEGLYEFGVIVRLPGSGCNAWASELDLEIAT